MKRIAAISIAAFCGAVLLTACAQHAGVPDNTLSGKPPIFLKEGVSDRQMIRDLNQCSLEAFRRSTDDEKTGLPLTEDPKTACMRARGYEITYN